MSQTDFKESSEEYSYIQYINSVSDYNENFIMRKVALADEGGRSGRFYSLKVHNTYDLMSTASRLRLV